MKRCSVLPVKTTRLYPNLQEEADTCAMIILHCVNTKTSLLSLYPVRSPDSDVLVLLARYCEDKHLTVLFNTGVGNEMRLLNFINIGQNTKGGIRTVLTAIYCFTGCDTTSVFVSQKGCSYQTDREPLPLVHQNSKQGREGKTAHQ